MDQEFGYANVIAETQKKQLQEIYAITEFPAADAPEEAANHWLERSLEDLQ